MFAAVADVKFGEEGAAPLFRIALTKDMCAVSATYAKGNDQTPVQTTDISGIATNKNKGGARVGRGWIPPKDARRRKDAFG